MATYKIKPDPKCWYCHGTGNAEERHPYGDTYASEYFLCSCIKEQLPEEFDPSIDEITIDLCPDQAEVGNDYDDDSRFILRPAREYEAEDRL